MLGFLAGAPARLKTLVDRLTATRAANLDNLDAAISTRAPSATALSTAIWTGPLATKLGNTIETTIIKSIQGGYNASTSSTGSGEDAKYQDITITSVDVSKSIVLWQPTSPTSSGAVLSTARLTSSTNLRLASRDSSGAVMGRWTVIEFK